MKKAFELFVYAFGLHQFTGLTPSMKAALEAWGSNSVVCRTLQKPHDDRTRIRSPPLAPRTPRRRGNNGAAASSHSVAAALIGTVLRHKALSL
jgi:hypothetical protein